MPLRKTRPFISRFLEYDGPCVFFTIITDTRESFAHFVLVVLVWASSEGVKNCYLDSKLHISLCE